MAIVKLSEFSWGLEQVYRGRNDNIFSRGTSRGTSRVEAYSNISRLENDNNNILHDKEKKITLKALKERENMLLSYLGGIRTPLETSTLETSIPVDNSQGDESMKYVTIKEAAKMIGKSHT